MDTRLLQAFLAVFEERSITAAAQRIHLSQPALSNTIQQLEGQLGTELFKRLPRGVDVTDAARTLYPVARRLVLETEALRRRFREQQDRVLLDIGVEHDLPQAWVQDFVRWVRGAVPNALLQLRSGCVGHARLASEELRCEDELFLPLWVDPLVLAMPETHPWAICESLDRQDLAEVSWVLCPSHASHQRLVPLYGSAIATPAAQADTQELAAQLVAAGAGLAVIPASLVAQVRGLVSKPLPWGVAHRRLGLCYALQALEHPGMQPLLDHLKALAPQDANA